MKKIYIIILIVLSLSFPVIACDMFMLQSINGYPLFTLPNSAGHFNDPYDYFEDFKSQANQSSGNRDGYGIVAYQRNNFIIDRDFMWYKTGNGSYFNENNPDEPFYEAISVLYDNPTIDKVLVHARSGTGGFGNHPFVFDANNRTYTFMHNGYIFNTVKQEILNLLGQEWFNEHPSQWQGSYFSSYSFIDSELIFHYFMYYFLQFPDDIPTAFRHAFNNKQMGQVDMEFVLKFAKSNISNFVLSDGEDTYVYRSSNIAGDLYNLSYQTYANHFVAIKTGGNLANTLTKNQLIRINSQGEVMDLSIDPILRTNFVNTSVKTIDNSLYELNWTIESNNQISGFNIYRALNRNFSDAIHITTINVESSNQTIFNCFDNYSSDLRHYYWIEVVFTDGTSEVTSSIPSSEVEEDINVFDIPNSISLFPNPFKDKLKIKIDSKEEYSVKIFNLKGQLVDKMKFQPNKSETLIWDTANTTKKFSNGIYILKFIGQNKTFIKKVIMIK